MSEMIGGREFATVKEFERGIRQLGLSEVDAQKARLDHQRQVFQARRAEQQPRQGDPWYRH